jgi:galactokinase
VRAMGRLLTSAAAGETTARLADEACCADGLRRAGVGSVRATSLGRRVARCAARLLELGGRPSAEACAFVVPGRIEVLGKHTDYGGGRSLLAATEQAAVVVAAGRADRRLVVDDLGLDRHVSVELAPDVERAPGDWSNYLRVPAAWLVTHFPDEVSGVSMAFESDLPRAAGLSSSSVLVTSAFLALSSLGAFRRSERFVSALPDRLALAECLAAIEAGRPFGRFDENDGVGTLGGSEDHTAIVAAVDGHLAQYAFGPVRFERAVAVPADHLFVVAASGVEASKTGAQLDVYNALSDRLRSVERISQGLEPHSPRSLGMAVEQSPGLVGEVRALLEREPAGRREALLARFDQFVAETLELVPGAADALDAGDLPLFGALVDRSQALAERGLGNQVAETVSLQRLARAAGAVASSAFGAGFGGSVWALVHASDVDRLERDWRSAYLRAHPERAATARFFRTRASMPAIRLELA